MTKNLILSVATLFVAMVANAAEPSDTLVDNRRPSHFHVGLELHTKYVWRGQEMMVSESAPVLFTELYYQYKGWRAYTKGGYATNGKFGQLNLGADYTYKWVSVGLTDYYFPDLTSAEDDYTKFSYGEARHLLEASLRVAPKKIPVSLMVATMIAGEDEYEDDQAYSTYAEIGAWYDFLDANRLSLNMGFCTKRSFYNDYHDFVNNVNIDLKYTYNLHLSGNRIVPLSASYLLNPIRDKAFVNFSMRFDF